MSRCGKIGEILIPYTTDSDERRNIPLIIAIFSIASAWVLPTLVNVMLNRDIPWWVEAPSVFGFYEIYFRIFNRHLWKLPLLSHFSIINVPNIGGKWIGKLSSSYNDYSTPVDIEVLISQTWEEIELCLITNASTSRNITCSIMITQNHEPTISYDYINEPKIDAKKTMHMHRGSARLYLKKDGNTLEGDYFSGRDRKEMGDISLKRVRFE